MYSKLDSLLDDTLLNELDCSFSASLDDFIQRENLNEDFKASFKSVYLPLSKWMESKHKDQPVVIGINGSQGSGKSTLCKLLCIMLTKLFHKNVLHLSIDDLYLSKAERLKLANTVHPLLQTRGVPGTHDVALGVKILEAIKKSAVTSLRLPVFDKAMDDLLDKEKWSELLKPVDIVLFEGWCVDAKPQLNHELVVPLNKLESERDKDMLWRKYVNAQLAGPYKKLFSYIDNLVMLKVPDMESVIQWRCLQERKLRQSTDNKAHIMSDEDIGYFIMFFERITQHCLAEMPDRADVVLALDKMHQVKRVRLK